MQVLLVAEKSRDITQLVDELKGEFLHVRHLFNISEAINFIKNERAEVIIIDSSNHEIASFEFCHAVKSQSVKSAVILISDKNNEFIEIEAFKAGADDFVTKPFRLKAFIHRIKSRLHQHKMILTIQPESLSGKKIRIDRESYSVFVGNDLVVLSPKEFELLYLFVSDPGRVFRREELSEKIWHKELNRSSRSLDAHILRLRNKLRYDCIKTQKGVGYKFNI